MLKKKCLLVFTTFLTLFVLLLLPSVSFAQQGGVGIKMNKTIIEDNVLPGQTVTQTVVVENSGAEEVVLHPLSRNITGTVNGVPQYSQSASENSEGLASWVTYNTTELVLPPGGKQALGFTIKFPDNARPGAHMAGLFVSQAPPGGVREGSAVGIEVATILHFEIAGDVVEKTTIREFLTDKLLYGASHVKFRVTMENSGNTLSRPQGLIDITNSFTDKKVDSVPFNEKAGSVFPGSKRDYEIAWDPENFTMGRYEAVLAVAVPLIDGSNQNISSVTQFWVLPMKVLGPILGGLLAFAIALFVLVKLYIKKQLAGLRPGPGGRVIYRNASGISRMTAVVIALLVAIILGFVLLFLLA